MATKDDVMLALHQVIDPELHRDIVTLKMVKDVEVVDGVAKIKVELTTPACPLKDHIRRDIEAKTMAVEGITGVEVEMGAKVRGKSKEGRLPNVKNVIAVASGKGGVGKSTLAVNLALALAKTGAKVGLLDTDLYGPSIPIMLGIKGQMPDVDMIDGKEMMIPIEAQGLKIMSIGLMIKETDAIIWRGPLLHKALTQFVEEVHWGDLDYLVLDLPPGTGDIQISLADLLPVTSAVVVTTPQDVAFADVLRAVKMFQVTKVPILGVIENMSGFVCPTCKTHHAIFGAGNIEAKTRELGLAFLGSVPLDAAVAPEADAGRPIVVSNPDSAPAQAITKLAGTIAGLQTVVHFQQ
ncbi:MAG TPA: Mrp/NBP35 family ATP-binding protein [Myxococcota bacterium]|nr:Mrp/NBP35 family ATP-binding protein [Myxococcota bacterium]HPL26390.1 Mrp/NBP35 family ATP-binding protein [Myxococcota bacterium]HQE74757.1 Mrp/NBP35 family ATP-binding protein [Myxococcota bacterium]HQI62864.1 Mrp/NBP35 family ATP-binding protein [Myxococcota bacterium]HRR75178.1 Mrp/NBP35 family ATP-binding protein [Myxococcota bacterium]